MTDIFEFWSRIQGGAHVHPADVKTFERMGAERHGFQLECLPGCFAGKLKSTPIVLLYLSPGLGDTVVADAESDCPLARPWGRSSDLPEAERDANSLAGNPAALKKFIDTGGGSLAHGLFGSARRIHRPAPGR